MDFFILGILFLEFWLTSSSPINLTDHSFNAFARLWRKLSNLGRKVVSTAINEGLLDFESLEKLYQVPRVGTEESSRMVSKVAVIRSGVIAHFEFLSPLAPPKDYPNCEWSWNPTSFEWRRRMILVSAWQSDMLTRSIELKLILMSQPRLASRRSFHYWLNSAEISILKLN